MSGGEKLQFAQLLETNDAAQVNQYLDSLKRVRIEIFKADAIRGFFFVLAAAGLVYLFSMQKVKRSWLIIGVGVLILMDMSSVNRRYLNNENFIRAREFDNPFTASSADNYILNDNSDFRVLDISKSTFNDASTSYFHKSIGGYHGAKLQRYQDLIDYNIQGEIEKVINELQTGSTLQRINEVFDNLDVLNMLNTKYVIYNPDGMPLLNNSTFGSAWFVNEIITVANPDEEIAELNNYDLGTTAIVDNKFSQITSKINISDDSSATIVQNSYAPNHLVYSSKSNSNQVAVFSEIYYDKGWNAYIDGQKVDYFRANYVLRALEIPSGEHTIEFRFEPQVFKIGERISFASSLLLILLLLGGIYVEGKKYFIN
jgi:hypothetical protein